MYASAPGDALSNEQEPFKTKKPRPLRGTRDKLVTPDGTWHSFGNRGSGVGDARAGLRECHLDTLCVGQTASEERRVPPKTVPKMESNGQGGHVYP